MEKIDIIELLKRVKEGYRPEKIKIGDFIFNYNDEWNTIDELYIEIDNGDGFINYITLNTRIKILDGLDKPIIEEIPTNPIEMPEGMIIEEVFAHKINEIIRHINKEEK